MPSETTMIYGGSGFVDEVDIDIPGPGSPPGMSTSKSSKTSSLRSYDSDDENGVIVDAANFEEIGLDDDAATIDASHSRDFQQTKSNPNPYSASFASDLRAASARHVGPKIHPQTQTRGVVRPHLPREITSGKKSRPAFPPSRPQFRDTSTQNLSMIGPAPQRGPLPMRGMPVRSASTLSVNRRRRSGSPNNQSLSPSDQNRPGLVRRSSWQTNRERKGVIELEKECDDDDDDIPDGFILDNVPLSPRPPTERSSSRPGSTSTSPERLSKDRTRNVGNGTPSVAIDSGSLRSPTWKTDSSPNPNMSGASSPKGRAKSWTAAVSALSAEAKALTEKLEEHADELDKHGVFHQPSLQSTAKPRVKSAFAELPPLRRTNIMIDPLPISKEKEAVLSRTRPSWLPPKDPAEEKKHIREYQRMMVSSIEAEQKREAALKEKERLKDKAANALIRVWEEDVLKRWDTAIHEKKTRTLWWRGVAPRCRGTVWSRAIGNELGLTENSFQAALSRAREIEARVAGGKATTEDERRMEWFKQIRRDVQEQTWIDLKIFQAGGPLHTALVDVLRAYAMYRSDIGYVSGCNTIAALLLLNLPTPSAVFMTLANVLNRSLPLSFYASDSGAKTSAYNYVLETLAQKSPKLHQHLGNRELSLEPDRYLAPTFTALFTQNISLDEATRLWDVYVFERDNVLISAAVALLLDREMSLLSASTSEEVRNALDYRSRSSDLAQGKEDEWIEKVRLAAAKS